MFSIPVGPFMHKPPGSRERFSINSPLILDASDEVYLTEPVQAAVEFLKLPHEINVQIHNLATAAECVCSLCLSSFIYHVTIPFVEREFLLPGADQSIPLAEDVFYVDMANREIVLDEMLRQEILLHFPAIALCSESCKGLCSTCGANLNKEECEHTRATLS